jgi:hypothetical protein
MARIMRYELTEREWAAIRPMLPNKPRGVPRVNDRRVVNGIFWVLRQFAQACARNLAQSHRAYARMMARPAVQRTIAIESAIGYELPA